MKINIDCSLILLLLSGMLALLKIGGQFPYSWIWVLAPIWIPLLALAGITIILIIAWIIGVIGGKVRRLNAFRHENKHNDSENQHCCITHRLLLSFCYVEVLLITASLSRTST